MYRRSLAVRTSGIGFVDLTPELARIVRESGVQNGIAVIFVRHTSASLIIQENADPRVRHDILGFFERLVPAGDPRYTHDDEGPDDMPAHIRALLTHTSEIVPVSEGSLLLGTWQALYLFEHRRQEHRRFVEVLIVG